MKTRTLIVLCVLLASMVSLAGDLPNFYIHTGITRPMAGPDEFKSSYRTGVNFGVMAGKQLASKFEVVGALAVHSMTFAVNEFRDTRMEENIDDFVIDGEPSTVLTAFAKAKLIMPAQNNKKAISYLFAGPGLFYVNKKAVTGMGPTQEEDFALAGGSETVLGICGGLGFEYTIETTTLFLELGVMAGLTNGESTITLPLKFGIAIK